MTNYFRGSSIEGRSGDNTLTSTMTGKLATRQSLNEAATTVSTFSLLSIVMLQFTTDHFFYSCGAARLRRTAASNGPIVHPPRNGRMNMEQ
jgi:hypothetical protein